MRCSDCVGLIAQKLAGTLSANELEGLQRHLAQCPQCRREELLQIKISEALAERPEGELSVGFTQRVMTRTQRLRRTRRAILALTRLAPAYGAAAVILLLLGFGIDLARAIPPAMEAMAQATVPPLVWLGEGVVGIFAHLPAVGTEPVGGVSNLGGSLTTMLGGVVIAIAAVFWAFSRVFSFMRE